jgi:hypothetical protein
VKLTERKRAWQAKPVYRVTELARMAGVSRWTMLRHLRRKGVPIDTGRGSVAMVTLVALRLAYPELWESMLLARALNG